MEVGITTVSRWPGNCIVVQWLRLGEDVAKLDKYTPWSDVDGDVWCDVWCDEKIKSGGVVDTGVVILIICHMKNYIKSLYKIMDMYVTGLIWMDGV